MGWRASQPHGSVDRSAFWDERQVSFLRWTTGEQSGVEAAGVKGRSSFWGGGQVNLLGIESRSAL
jgi:hypothetical protein